MKIQTAIKKLKKGLERMVKTTVCSSRALEWFPTPMLGSLGFPLLVSKGTHIHMFRYTDT